MKESLSPQERIRKREDFLFLYKKGNRYRGKYFSLIYLSNNFSFSRIAVVASKKIGNAVARNKIKRWMRDLFRRNKELLKSPFDIIIVAKKEIQNATWSTLKEEYIATIESICQRRESP
jgi:ribonuclease P protein component